MHDICVAKDLEELCFTSQLSHRYLGQNKESSTPDSGSYIVDIGSAELIRLTEGKKPVDSYMNDELMNTYVLI